MKTVLIALNARFAHSSLALRYLKAYNPEFEITIREFNINDSPGHLYAALSKERAEVYAFSCYIWNIELTCKIAEMLKTARPEVTILFGGPEAGWRAEALLREYPWLDMVMCGEGEETLGAVLAVLERSKYPDDLRETADADLHETVGVDLHGIVDADSYGTAGASLRETAGAAADSMAEIRGLALPGRPVTFAPPLDLSRMPQPYTAEDIRANRDKILYFETARGCPFHCAYCLSSAEETVRPFPMAYVKEGLSRLFAEKVPLVKLIDRTFNYDSTRAAEILRFILDESDATCVHMELEPRILTEELIELLGSAPKGKFQVEMGIQSANPKTLAAVGRVWDAEQTAAHIQKLRAFGNLHMHLDLIAGLPYEDYQSFAASFDYVYARKPDMLQLGFLKLLPGTALAQSAGIAAASFPPYEVVRTDWLSAEEICRLKEVEEAVELFYNSGAFPRTIAMLTRESPFAAFESLGAWVARIQQTGRRKRRDWYPLLYERYGERLRTALSEDFIRHNKSIPLPAFTRSQREHGFKDAVYRLLRSSEFCARYGIEPNPAEIRFERMDGRGWMMDYQNGNLFDITEEIETEYAKRHPA